MTARADRPRRRSFTPEYKLRILAEYEALDKPGARGALLRREGCTPRIWSSGAGARDAGALEALGLQPRPRGRSPEQAEIDRLRPALRRPSRSWPRRRRRWRSWESARALGTALRERGLRADVDQVIVPAVNELGALTSTATACRLLGRPRASHYRARRPVVPTPRAPRPAPPNALTDEERQHALETLNSERFRDKSVTQTWATLLASTWPPAAPCTGCCAPPGRPATGAGRPPIHPGRSPSCWRPNPTRLDVGHHQAARPGPRRLLRTCTWCSTSSAATPSAGPSPPARTPTWPVT